MKLEAHLKKRGINMTLEKTALQKSVTRSDVMEHYDALYKASVYAKLFRDVEDQFRENLKDSESRTIAATQAVDKKLGDSVNYLEKKIDDLTAETREGFKRVDKRIDDLTTATREGFKRLDKKIDDNAYRLDGRIDQLDGRLERLEDGFIRLESVVFGLKKWNFGIMLGIATLVVGVIAIGVTLAVYLF